jgi:hypothetical protein
MKKKKNYSSQITEIFAIAPEFNLISNISLSTWNYIILIVGFEVRN